MKDKLKEIEKIIKKYDDDLECAIELMEKGLTDSISAGKALWEFYKEYKKKEK